MSTDATDAEKSIEREATDCLADQEWCAGPTVDLDDVRDGDAPLPCFRCFLALRRAEAEAGR